MKKHLDILIMTMAVVALSACGSWDDEEDIQIRTTENSGGKAEFSSTAKKEIKGGFYEFLLPEDFIEQESEDEDIREWHSDNFDETEFSVLTYDVGHSTYEFDTIPKTFDEYIEKSTVMSKNGVSEEEISFDYNNDSNYEEYLVIEKAIYGEGSDIYEITKLEKTLESTENRTSDENLLDAVVIYTAKKAIVNQNDRSEVISIVIQSNENGDIDEMQEILNSFQWK